MIQNPRSKVKKDIESAAETVIPGISHMPGNSTKSGFKPNTSVTSQIAGTDNFDNYIEKVQ